MELKAFDEEQEKLTLYKTLETDTSHIRDRETEARQAFADACTRITDGHPVTQTVAGTVGGFFAPNTKDGGWRAAAGVGTWAISRVGNGVKMAEAIGLRASGANVTRKVGSSKAMKYAGRAGTAVSFGVDAYQQWEKDSHNPSIGTGEKVARAATAGAGSAAGGWAGAQTGAAIGVCCVGPVVIRSGGPVRAGAVPSPVGHRPAARYAAKPAQRSSRGAEACCRQGVSKSFHLKRPACACHRAQATEPAAECHP